MKKKFIGFLRIMYNRFIFDTIPAKGAEISFYLLLSFFPLLIFIITLISYIPMIHLSIYIDSLSKMMPSNAFSIVSYIIGRAISDKSTNLLIVSFLIMLWSATNAVSAIIRGVNKAYDQEETRHYLKVTAISVLFTLELVLLITFSLVLVVYGNKISNFIIHFFKFETYAIVILNWVRYIIAIITMLLLFLSLYMYTPNHRLKVKDVYPGSIVSTLGWITSSLIFSYYANNYINYSLLYGSIGGIVALLSWLYLSSMVILIGAEVNAAFYFKKIGKRKKKSIRY
jgi:membrane protein